MRRGFACVLLAALLAATTIVSALFISGFHDHACCGHDCSVCTQLEVANAVLNGGVLGATVLGSLCVAFAYVLCARVFTSQRKIVETLVANKVLLRI